MVGSLGIAMEGEEKWWEKEKISLSEELKSGKESGLGEHCC